MNYQHYNTELLNNCLSNLGEWIGDKNILELTELALKKSLKAEATHAVPPVLSILVAEDMKLDPAKLQPLFRACAYFYAAADLLDDIQDKDPDHPILKKTSADQALNIVNLLLMGSYQNINTLLLPAPQKLALMQMFTTMGTQMSFGQYWDIASTNASSFEYLSEDIIKSKAGAELGCFVACISCATGQDSKVFYELGENIGILLQVFSDYFDIWIQPNPQAISEDILALKNSFPLAAARQDTKWKQQIDLALAGTHENPQKQFALRRLLAQSETIEKFEKLLKDLDARLQKHFLELPSLPQIKLLSDTYMERAHQLLAGLKKLKKVTSHNSVWKPSTNPEKTLVAALDYLCFVPDFRDAWEVQRWGFLGEPTLYGDTFNTLLILEALYQSDKNIEKPLRNILDKKSEHGWHYYSNTLNIPPDTDDLGQLLQLVVHLPKAEYTPLMKPVLQNLMHNLEKNGKCPTWLCDEERYVREDVEKNWFGNECIAVMANLYYGLACYDTTHYAKEIHQGITYIAGQYDKEAMAWKSTHYQSELYTLYLIARLFKKQSFAFDFGLCIDNVLKQQKLDGSWNKSPQETAFALLFLETVANEKSKHLETVLLKARIFLMDTQLHDGSWQGENLFIRPGKNASFEFFKHPKITTSFCVRALVINPSTI